MSTNVPQNQNNEEIDLGQISKKISEFLGGISTFIFKCIQYLLKNIKILAFLFIIGLLLGFYLDISSKNYNHNIIVNPNFGTNDYLYAKVNLVNARIKENDTVFLKSIGIKHVDRLNSIKIIPIVDIYKFVDHNESNFELIKLLAEDSDINKIAEDKMTSKNYQLHELVINTSDKINENDLIVPFLKYLNSSDYYSKYREGYVNNLEIKMRENDSIIKQIDGFLSDFKNKSNGTKSSNLVYYNENNQINEIIKTKDGLIAEQGGHRIELINLDKIVKDISIVSNIRNTKSTNNKLKFVLPLLFVFIFVLGSLFRSFYSAQLKKSRLE